MPGARQFFTGGIRAATLLSLLSLASGALATACGGGDQEAAPQKSEKRDRSEVRTLAVDAKVPVRAKFIPGERALSVAIGAGAVWATDGTSAVFKIDPATKKVVRVIRMPGASIVAADDEQVWVTGGRTTDVVAPIDSARNTVGRKRPVVEEPVEMVAGEGAFWVAGRREAALARIDRKTGLVTKIELPEEPFSVGVGEGAAWAISAVSLSLFRIDLESKEIDTVQLDGTPESVAAGGGAAWVAESTSNRVLRLDSSTGDLEEAIEIPVKYGTVLDSHLAFGDGSVWLQTGTHVVQIDAAMNAVAAVAPISQNRDPAAVVLSDIAVGEAGVWVGDGDAKAVVRVASQG